MARLLLVISGRLWQLGEVHEGWWRANITPAFRKEDLGELQAGQPPLESWVGEGNHFPTRQARRLLGRVGVDLWMRNPT